MPGMGHSLCHPPGPGAPLIKGPPLKEPQGPGEESALSASGHWAPSAPTSSPQLRKDAVSSSMSLQRQC